MELGGVSVPGLGAQSGGAYLVKDLTVFEAQLGGLKAFVMVSDGTADDESSGAASQLAVKAANAYLESVLRSIASGQAPVVDPALTLKAIVAQVNTAIATAAGEPDAARMDATFVGAMISAERAWLGSAGDGVAYLLRGDEARKLVVGPAPPEAVPDDVPTDGEVPDSAPADTDATDSGREGLEIEVGSVFLNPGDAIVLLGRAASADLSGADIRAISCAACDARVAATNLAGAVAKSDPEQSATVAVWSADSALFSPAPVPAPAPQPSAATPIPAPVVSANNDLPRGLRAEKIFLWVMSGWIVLAFLALAVGMVYSATKSTAKSTAAVSAAQTAAAAAAAQEATATSAASETVPAEFPKKLIVPKNVKGGVWLRKNPTTLGGANEVAVLKGGAEVQVVDMTQGTDEKGQTQDFYVLKVSQLSAKQIAKTTGHPWPPAKSVKTVYVFTGSFQAP
jgi:hypothetical protein